MNYQTEISTVIANFQKNRGYTINELIDGIISRTQYYRFMNGSSIRTEQLLLLLDRLNISLSEFELELGRDLRKEYDLYQRKMRAAFMRKDIAALSDVQKATEKIYAAKQMSKFQHLSILCQFLISRIQQSPIPKDCQVIANYLLKLDKWQLYDIELFTNSFASFDDAIIPVLIKRLDKDLDAYDSSDHRTKIAVTLYCDLCLVAVQKQAFPETKIYFERIKKFKIPNDFVLERMYQRFFYGLEKIINGNITAGETICRNVLTGLQLLEITDYYLMLNSALEFTIKHVANNQS